MKKLFYLLLMLPALVFASCNDDDDNPPAIELSSTVTSFIETNYPGAVIAETEWTANGLIEVDVVQDGVRKDIYFTKNSEWVLTEWDVTGSSLPQSVKDAVASVYPEYLIDDVDYIQQPTGDSYKINIEKGNFEKDLKVSLDGSVIEEI